MSKPNKHKILLVLNLPPPFHGSSIANQNVAESLLLRECYRLSVMDIKTSASLEEIGKFSLGKIWSSIKTFFLLFFRLLYFRPRLVYFTPAPSGFAFYRDACYILLIKLFCRRIILHLHGKGYRQGIATKRLYRILAKKIFRGSNCIHLSALLEKDLPGLQIRKRYIVPNGIAVVTRPGIFRPANDTTNILFLSNYVRTKGILDLLDAIIPVTKKQKDFHLRLVGKPYDISIEFLEEYLRDNQLEKFVTICGPRYGEEKYHELMKADIYVFPSYYENEAFPISLLEAMQFGLPCITTFEGGIPDMIADGTTGYIIQPRDCNALSEKIITLIDSPLHRQQMGAEAQRVFFENYTLSLFEKNIKAVFDNVLNEKK